ncbi:MAG: VapC toxin family PIN domain ribonuclease [Cytophagales bacterium CG12_big_fil_rev_8_21_14_0_65_40_12]|nr:MAG: VapC toxin family PIN domain ribonuclease [Cytophagales bacterium CG12_big_fil_rev_8_21_14_0_65_40_12]PIW03855.1 MAG: VapC toxin family PIN domain ribonuclease [Cytophagales bacterium CG17_big_fil_post_rev_8_21_14_2_50_40_13]
MNYLLDTNICIYYLKGQYGLNEKLKSIGANALFISEITLAELKYGVANSLSPEKNTLALDKFLSGVNILPIFDALDIYALEKARLRKLGKPVDDFDIIIGASAISNNMILVTNNVKHFERLENINIENWTE